jgi:hypothetical protein
VSAQLHNLVTLPLVFTEYRRLGGPQSWFLLSEEEKKLLSLPGLDTQVFVHPSHSVVSILSELSQFFITAVSVCVYINVLTIIIIYCDVK